MVGDLRKDRCPLVKTLVEQQWEWSPATVKVPLGPPLRGHLKYFRSVEEDSPPSQLPLKLCRAQVGSCVLESFYGCVLKTALSTSITVWHRSWSAVRRVKAAQKMVGYNHRYLFQPIQKKMLSSSWRSQSTTHIPSSIFSAQAEGYGSFGALPPHLSASWWTVRVQLWHKFRKSQMKYFYVTGKIIKQNTLNKAGKKTF